MKGDSFLMANTTQIPSLQDLLEAGVHFGHQVKRWHPQMAPYIYGARDNIHIIDLLTTRKQLEEAAAFVKEQAAEGKVILFLGTKRQAQDIIKEEAQKCGMPYLYKRWIGGFITNWEQMKRNLEKLRNYDNEVSSGKLNKYTKKEQLLLKRNMAKLGNELVGVKQLTALPDVLFIIDPKKEDNAVREAIKKDIKTVVLCDTNTNPQPVNYPIAGNDDSLKSLHLIIQTIADAVLEGKALYDKKGDTKKNTAAPVNDEAVVANIEAVLEEVVEEVEGIVKDDEETEKQNKQSFSTNNENTPSEQQSEAMKTDSDISEKKQSKEKVVKAVKAKKTTKKKTAVKKAKKVTDKV